MMNSYQIEQSILGGLFCLGDMKGNVASSVLTALKTNMFNTAEHRAIFEAFRKAQQNDVYADILMIDQILQKSGDGWKGSLAYLGELHRDTPSAANIKEFGRILREESVKRFTMSTLQEAMVELSQNDTVPLAQKLGLLETKLSQIAGRVIDGTKGMRHISDISSDVLEAMDGFWSGNPDMQGVSSGFSQIDAVLGPKKIRRGSLVVVGARPKMGKTAFLGQFCKSIAVEEKQKAIIFSLEMVDKDIAERMIAEQAGISSACLYDGENREYNTHMAMFGKAMQELIQHDIYVDDTPAITIDYVKQTARQMNREGKIGVIALDYLTLMDAPKADRNDLAYGVITKQLKNLAKELNCVVLLLTQLSRGLESRSDKRPLPSDSRDTGQIEQDCDVWIGLYREGVYNSNMPADKKGITEIIVRLNRHGGNGTGYANLVNGYFREIDPAMVVTEDNGNEKQERNWR